MVTVVLVISSKLYVLYNVTISRTYTLFSDRLIKYLTLNGDSSSCLEASCWRARAGFERTGGCGLYL